MMADGTNEEIPTRSERFERIEAKRITTQELIILDKDGIDRAQLWCDDEGNPNFIFVDKTGATRLSLGFTLKEDDLLLSVDDAQGKPLLQFTFGAVDGTDRTSVTLTLEVATAILGELLRHPEPPKGLGEEPPPVPPIQLLRPPGPDDEPPAQYTSPN